MSAEYTLGLDLSASRDLTALAFVVRTGMVEVTRPDGTSSVNLPFDAWVEAWTPADTRGSAALQDQVPYDVWVEQGTSDRDGRKLVRMDFVAARVAERNVNMWSIARF